MSRRSLAAWAAVIAVALSTDASAARRKKKDSVPALAKEHLWIEGTWETESAENVGIKYDSSGVYRGSVSTGYALNMSLYRNGRFHLWAYHSDNSINDLQLVRRGAGTFRFDGTTLVLEALAWRDDSIVNGDVPAPEIYKNPEVATLVIEPDEEAIPASIRVTSDHFIISTTMQTRTKTLHRTSKTTADQARTDAPPSGETPPDPAPPSPSAPTPPAAPPPRPPARPRR